MSQFRQLQKKAKSTSKPKNGKQSAFLQRSKSVRKEKSAHFDLELDDSSQIPV